MFYVLIGVLLKGVAERCLLSKDEPLTPNIDKVVAVWCFRRRVLKTKIGKTLTSWFRYMICFSAHTGANLLKCLQGTALKRSRPLKKYSKRFTSCWEISSLNLIHPISQPNLAQCTLCWQFENQKDMYLVLWGSRVIHLGTMYDTEPLGTSYLHVRSNTEPKY